MLPDVSGTILNELWMALYAVGLGALMSIVYDGLRLTRRLLPRSLVWVSIEDVCFWLAFGLVFWNMTYLRMDGELRLYVILSMLLGLGIYSAIKKTLKKSLKLDKMLEKKRSRKKGE
jgi:hypothetical protein